MSGAPSGKPQSEKELKTTRALNTVATIGAGHALYAMTPEKKREAVRSKLLKIAPGKTRPRAEKFLATLKQPELGGKLTTAGKVVAGGWLGLHSAELVGDVMARRSINNQLAQVQAQKNKGSVGSVKKNDMSMISKADGSVSRNGHGKGISDNKSNYVPGTIAATGGGAGAAYYGNKAYKMNRTANQLASKKPSGMAELLMNANGVEVAGKSAKRSLKGAAALGVLGAAGAAEMAVARKGKHPRLKDVSKAYRRFDPEADRQRRLGLYAGTGVGGSIVAGREAARNFETKVKTGSGTKAVTQRGLYAKPGQGKKGLGLAAIAAASGALGVGSYKRGLSQRNQPWT